MIKKETISCGGVVVHNSSVLILHNISGKWVLPKGTKETGESLEQTAIREVKEETNIDGTIHEYITETNYSFIKDNITYNKTVHWFLMMPYSYNCIPQAEEGFDKAEFVDINQAINQLYFENERNVVKTCKLK